MTSAELTTTTQGVGIPLAERRLTSALDVAAPRIVAPGAGRSLIHLKEVELGTGRPDSILVAISSAGLQARHRAGLRLPSLAHARVLDSILTGKPASYSSSHVSQLTRSLRELGWISDSRHVRSVPRLVDQSLTVEAKMSDWRTGIVQLSRARWASHQAALLMPPETQHRVPRRTLRHNRLGLLVLHQDDVQSRVRAPNVDLRWVADLWLTELAIRSIEDGQT